MDLFSIVISIVILVTLGLCITLVYWYKKTLKHQQEIETELEQLKARQLQSGKEMEKALSELHQITQLLQDSITPSSSPSPEVSPSITAASQPRPLKEFFMAIPNQDGSFHAQAYSETFKPTVSLYRFNEISEGKAEFEFYPDTGGLRDALNFSSAYLTPACEELNDIRPDTKEVITVEKGLASLSDNRWIILKKTKIRYA